MPKAIHKFPIRYIETQAVTMPANARVLGVQIQKDVPCIWALVDMDSQQQEERVFDMFTTGEDLPDDIDSSWRYIGTFRTRSGLFVHHLFERF